MSTHPAESFYRATIRQTISDNQTCPFTLKVSKTPKLSSGLGTLSPNTANEELYEYSGKDDAALTITVVKRGINPSSQALTTNGTDYNNPTYQFEHSQNDNIRSDVNHLHIIQDYGNLQTQINTKVNIVGGKRTGLNASSIMRTDGTGAEIDDIIDTITPVSSDTFIMQRSGNIVESSYDSVKNDLSNSGKYLISGILGEKLDGIITSAIPTLGANADSSSNTASGSSILNATYDFFKAFDKSGVTSWIQGGGNGTVQYVTIQNPYPKIFTGFTLRGYYWATGWTIEGSNDNAGWTILYTSGVPLLAPTDIPLTTFVNTTPYLYYRFRGTTTNIAGNVSLTKLDFQQQLQSSEPIPCALVTGATQFPSTLGSNIAGSRIKSGITFSIPFATTLGVVNVGQNATSTSARIQLLSSSGVLIAEQTPGVGTNTVSFPNVSLLANTVYKLVINDSTYFNAQNNELSLATYKSNFQYIVSGTLNGVETAILPQAISLISIGTKKIMRTTAVLANEYAVLSGFITFPKTLGDYISLNSNDATLVTGLLFNSNWIMTKMYLSNILGQLSPVAGTASRQVGLAVNSSELYISSTFYPGTTITKP